MKDSTLYTIYFNNGERMVISISTFNEIKRIFKSEDSEPDVVIANDGERDLIINLKAISFIK